MSELHIPCAMLTQHPDAASRYVSVQEEPDEAVRGLLPPPEGLGADEIMVDFEGKLTPYHQTSQVVLALLQHGVKPGDEIRVTPRAPSADKENVFRQLMALMSIVETNVQAYRPLERIAVREVIVPMTQTADQLVAVRRRFRAIEELGLEEFGLNPTGEGIQPIPLIEEVPPLLGTGSLLREYLQLCRWSGYDTPYLRVMLGHSDSALGYGMVAAALSVRAALIDAFEAGDAFDCPVFPIIGVGSLPFRGHLTGPSLPDFLERFPGTRTVTIQGAIRYDHDPAEAPAMIAELRRRVHEGDGRRPDRDDREVLAELAVLFSVNYLNTFHKFAQAVAGLSDLVPEQRDRLTRHSPVSYSRQMPKPSRLAEMVGSEALREELRLLDSMPELPVPLPRAISFTASLYSIGLPPEFIGTGRGLRAACELYGESFLKDMGRWFPGLKEALTFAGRYLDLDVAKDFLPREAMQELRQDVDAAEELLHLTLGPQTEEDQFYHTVLRALSPLMLHALGRGSSRLGTSREEETMARQWVIKLGTLRGCLG
ncbi:MAG TPA: phosphoenolpyruvate carboxylase [Dehalococcoidia bacterium]|nr:phosphoenolpyruvate carboxylase [Dehalococcoidia bacterium]